MPSFPFASLVRLFKEHCRKATAAAIEMSLIALIVMASSWLAKIGTSGMPIYSDTALSDCA